jgi:hypothetical protein
MFHRLLQRVVDREQSDYVGAVVTGSHRRAAAIEEMDEP